jgi:UDP-N-acetylglucosamine:LPS N-acetylglucosamine transferase
VVSGSVGAGHDGAARELAARLAAVGVSAPVRDFLHAVPPPVRWALREGYSTSVQFVPGTFELLFQRLERRGLSWRIARAVCAAAEATMLHWVDELCPDVVVSTYPLASQTLGSLRGSGRLAAPVITYLTDPAVHVSWLHEAVDQHLAVSAATADQSWSDYGQECMVAGPLVPARFAEPPGLGRLAELRRELGLQAAQPVALLVAGSLGLGDLLPTVRDVAAAGFVPLVLCGRNDRLRRRLAGEPQAVPLGWRTDVDQLMQLADVLVQNAGGLSSTEALVAGLPMVTYRPIPGHGRANARVMEGSGQAPWARTPAQLADVLHARLGSSRTPPALGDPAALVLAALRRNSVAVAAA